MDARWQAPLPPHGLSGGRTLDTMLEWHDIYARLSESTDGLVGSVTARAVAHVLRPAMLDALLDGDTVVRPAQLRVGVTKPSTVEQVAVRQADLGRLAVGMGDHEPEFALPAVNPLGSHRSADQGVVPGWSAATANRDVPPRGQLGTDQRLLGGCTAHEAGGAWSESTN